MWQATRKAAELIKLVSSAAFLVACHMPHCCRARTRFYKPVTRRAYETS